MPVSVKGALQALCIPCRCQSGKRAAVHIQGASLKAAICITAVAVDKRAITPPCCAFCGLFPLSLSGLCVKLFLPFLAGKKDALRYAVYFWLVLFTVADHAETAAGFVCLPLARLWFLSWYSQGVLPHFLAVAGRST